MAYPRKTGPTPKRWPLLMVTFARLGRIPKGFHSFQRCWLHHLWNTPFFATVRLTARPVPRWCSRHKTAFFAPFRTGWDRNHHGIWKDIHVAIPWDVGFCLVVWNLFFPHILGIIIPTDELIFFRGVAKNHQAGFNGHFHGMCMIFMGLDRVW